MRTSPRDERQSERERCDRESKGRKRVDINRLFWCSQVDVGFEREWQIAVRRLRRCAFGSPTCFPRDLVVHSKAQSCPQLQYVSRIPARVSQAKFVVGYYSRGGQRPAGWMFATEHLDGCD